MAQVQRFVICRFWRNNFTLFYTENRPGQISAILDSPQSDHLTRTTPLPPATPDWRYTMRLTSNFLILPIARVGLRPFGQTSTQFMIEWHCSYSISREN